MQVDKVRSARSYDKRAVSRASALVFDYENPHCDMAQQSFKTECDINEIVRRFGITGQLPENLRMPVSGDFTEIRDFQTAMNQVIAAQEEFLKVPAEVRKRFGNDPGAFMAFVEDEANRDEARKLGLLKPEVEKTRDAVQAIDELASKLVPPKA